jgi:hypothetical protein
MSEWTNCFFLIFEKKEPTVERYWQGKTEELGEKPVPVPLCPPQILLDWPGRETRPPRWEACDVPPEPWHGQTALCLNTSGPSAKTTKPVSLSTPPFIVYKALCSKSSCAYRTQDLLNRARFVSCALSKTPPVVKLLGWLLGCFGSQRVILPSSPDAYKTLCMSCRRGSGVLECTVLFLPKMCCCQHQTDLEEFGLCIVYISSSGTRDRCDVHVSPAPCLSFLTVQLSRISLQTFQCVPASCVSITTENFVHSPLRSAGWFLARIQSQNWHSQS